MCTTLAERRDFPEYRCSADQSQFGGTDWKPGAGAGPGYPGRTAVLAGAPARSTDAGARRSGATGTGGASAIHNQWELRLERARDLAKRAERKSQAVEPENRLVARQLPKQWEERLRAVETVEKEYHAWKVRRFGTLTQADREAIVALGSDFPARWQAETTTTTERKQMLRLVIREVIIDSKRAEGQVWVQINWQTGAQEQFW